MSAISPPTLTDRQARALIVAAEARGFEREPDRIWWSYDETLHADAQAAREFLAEHPEEVAAALTADDPMPTWVAVERIANERAGMNFALTRPLIDAAVERGLMRWEGALHDARFDAGERAAALEAIGLLFEHDPEVLTALFGEHARIALLPETAMYPCPSVCDPGWVVHKLAGEVPAERPEHWSLHH